MSTFWIILAIVGLCVGFAVWASFGLAGLRNARFLPAEAEEDTAALQGATGAYEEPDHVRILREGFVTRQEIRRKRALIFEASKKERAEALAAKNGARK